MFYGKERTSHMFVGAKAENINVRDNLLLLLEDDSSDSDADEKRSKATEAEDILGDALHMAQEKTGSMLGLQSAPRNVVLEMGRRISSLSLRTDDGSMKSWNSKLTETTFIKVEQGASFSNIDFDLGDECKHDEVKQPPPKLEQVERSDNENDEEPIQIPEQQEEPYHEQQEEPVQALEGAKRSEEETQNRGTVENSEWDLETVLEPEEGNPRKWDKLRNTLKSEEKEKNGSCLGFGLGKGLGLFRIRRKTESLGETDDEENSPNQESISCSNKKFWGRKANSSNKNSFMVNISVHDLTSIGSSRKKTRSRRCKAHRVSETHKCTQTAEEESPYGDVPRSMEEGESMEVVYTGLPGSSVLPPFPSKMLAGLR